MNKQADATRHNGSSTDARQIRVAWLAPYDLRSVADRVSPPLRGGFHNSPWITNGCRALVESGAVDLHVVTHDKRIARNVTLTQEGITFHLLRPPIPAIPRIALFYELDRGSYRRTLDKISPDVVHGHGTENVFSYAAVTGRYPHVITIQALISQLVRAYRSFSRDRLQHELVRLVEHYTLRRARSVFVKAPFVERLIRQYNQSMTVQLADNIVSPPFFGVQRTDVPSKKIMFVGRLTPTKGVEETIQAFHDVAGSNPALELHLIGEGRPGYVRNRLRALVEAGAGARRITVRGYLSAPMIAAECTDAAMLVLPTYYDTSPNAIAEAMVAGVPVIGTSVGGLPYMLEEGALGQLVPVAEVAPLAEAITFNLENTEIAGARALRARAVARTRHSKELFVNRMLDMYRNVAAGAFNP